MQIASSGASFEMLARGRTTHELMQIVNAARTGGAIIYIVDARGFTTHEIMQIGAAGRGHVVFK
ncbi:hypothetical protein [Halobacteriovorax sp. HFRX-1_3]